MSKRPEKETADETRWVVPYADLVTLLLGLFVVLYASADTERAEQIAAAFQDRGPGILNGSNTPDDPTAKPNLTSSGPLISKITFRETKKKRIYSLDGAAFFEPGNASLSNPSRSEIQKIAAALKDSKAAITIEGHTDSRPISNSRFRSNWELSTSRAAAVLDVLIDAGISPKRLSAAGYGGFRPIAENTSAEGREKNRRVDIVVEKLTVSSKTDDFN